MSPETWIAFLATASVMLLIPGPAILLVTGQSPGGGRRAALPLVARVAADGSPLAGTGLATATLRRAG